MVLHPGMKFEYFCNQKWENECIAEAEHLVWEEYAEKYEKVAEESNDAPKKNLPTKVNDGFTSFGDLSVTTSPCPNKIQEYLSHAIKNVKDPLKWWVENKYVYPKLHCMALDCLSIPATSTSVKWVLQGRHLLPFSCNSLSPSSIHAFLCFRSWSHCGLVVLDDVVAAVTVRIRA